ncbi:hypothetical protein NHF46_09455 [Arthrobacter alpinus]|nr:hypothetical protein [Arthrobacter alpinus]
MTTGPASEPPLPVGPAVNPAVTRAAASLKRTPRPSSSAIAQTLAQAFLASPQWTKAELVAAGAHALGARRRWLGPLAAQVVRGYPRPPLDAPRELGAMIGSCDPFIEATAKALQQRKPILIANYVLAPSVARENRHAGVPRSARWASWPKG